MQKQNLLIEIGTEELPPDGLFELGEAFAQTLRNLCSEAGFDSKQAYSFATPRRIAARLDALIETQADRIIKRKGPLIEKAYDEDGNPLPAAIGFAKSCGVEISELQIIETKNEQRLYIEKTVKGQNIKDCIAVLLEQTLQQLPMSKRMRWGDTDYAFIRPIHWVLTLYGEQTLKLEVAGITSGKHTYGHRYHFPNALAVSHADDYENLLEQQAKVIPSFKKRLQKISLQIEEVAQLGKVQTNNHLLKQVTSIVEWPIAVSGRFDKCFLSLPAIVISKILEKDQKCFTVLAEDGTLAPEFIVIANIESTDPDALRHGYERVVEPRLKDANFFVDQDRKHSLAHYADSLDKLVFHQRLGNLADKVARITNISLAIAQYLSESDSDYGFDQHDKDAIKRAAYLCKADLRTSIVCEYTELAGYIGSYYAECDGEPSAICRAIRQHIKPVRAGDSLPEEKVAIVLAIADRLDTLVGIFGTGEYPSGSRDPYALRRASLALIRILTEYQLDLDLAMWVEQSQQQYDGKVKEEGVARLLDYLQERLKHYFIECEFSSDRVDAVSVNRPLHCHDMQQCLLTLQSFMQMSESVELAVATKRIRNILKNNLSKNIGEFDPEALYDDAERRLFEAFNKRSPQVQTLIDHGDYLEALKTLAQLREPIDNFFDKVLVMSENEAEKNNRLGLLYQIDRLFMQIVDFSKLQLEE